MDYTSEEIAKLRQEEDWLNSFKLTDDAFYLIVTGMTRVILGRDSLDAFYNKVAEATGDKVLAKTIALQASEFRFLSFRKDIIGLDDFIKKMGGQAPAAEPVAEPEERNIRPESAAKMVFSSTDEEEIKALPTFEHKGPSADDYVAQARAIIKEFNFKEKDEVIVKRLEGFIIGKLRDVRDDIELLEVLTKSRKIGGLELDEEKARFLVKLINDKEKDFHNGIVPEMEPENKQRIEFPVYQEPQAGINSVTTKTAESGGELFKPLTLQEKREKDGFDVKDAIIDSSAPTASPAPAMMPRPEKMIEDLPIDSQPIRKKDFGFPSKEDVYPIIEEEDGLPVIRMPDEVMVAPKVLPPRQSAPRESVAPVKKEEIIPVTAVDKSAGNAPTEPARQEIVTVKTEASVFKKPANLPPPMPAPYIAPAKTLPPKTAMFAARRPSLDDVKFVRKLVGPIEELETMTIIDFRRLDSDPKVAVKKIKEKVSLLEKELYQKRAEGIAAWHKSEVSRFYRLLGQASMAEGRSIEEIIAERRQAAKPTLTLEEFNAIMELNKELRY